MVPSISIVQITTVVPMSLMIWELGTSLWKFTSSFHKVQELWSLDQGGEWEHNLPACFFRSHLEIVGAVRASWSRSRASEGVFIFSCFSALLQEAPLSETALWFSCNYCLLNLQQRKLSKCCLIYPVKMIVPEVSLNHITKLQWEQEHGDEPQWAAEVL